MKFGHSFKEALAGETYPQHWVEKAIPYRQLKKVLGKVREELIKNGYDPDTLHKLLADHNAEYILRVGDSHLVRPKLVVRPISGAAPLSPTTLAKFEALTAQHTISSTDDSDAELENASQNLDHDHQHSGWVKIPLNSDAKFFNILQSDVVELDSLQTQERKLMNDKIHVLGDEISAVARPRKGLIKIASSDLYRWREIFEIYLAAQVFFSTSETKSGTRTSEKAHHQLVWFQEEVNRRKLPQKFKLDASSAAYAHFLSLNATLLQNFQFQELNRTAVTKIIKSKPFFQFFCQWHALGAASFVQTLCLKP